jgi:hypothetical protein
LWINRMHYVRLSVSQSVYIRYQAFLHFYQSPHKIFTEQRRHYSTLLGPREVSKGTSQGLISLRFDLTCKIEIF